jgi:hypothetical protein
VKESIMASSKRAALAASAVLILTLTWTLSAAGAQPPQLTLTFSGKTITASGLTPRGEAIFFAEAQEEGEYTMLTYSHYERFAAADASGTAHIDIDADIVPTSIWAVVDTTSGAYSVTAPPGGARKSKPIHGGLLRRSAGGDITGLDFPFAMGSILMVRPGVGVWHASAAEEGAADEKGHGRGKIITPIPELKPIRGANLTPITTLQGGDVVVIIEPQYLYFYATQVNGR